MSRPEGVTEGADRPLLTFCDGATGERTELTATELGGWAARTAALLRDGCGLDVGDRAAVLLPAHWQTAAVLLGAWSIGVAVSFRPRATAGLPVLGPGADEPLDAVFASWARLDDWLENVPEGRHRFVLGLGDPRAEVPDGWRDFLPEVRRHGDAPPAYAAVHPSFAATPDGTSYHAWGELARHIADSLDLRPGDRLLVDAAEHEEPVKWLLAPLVAGASVVVCANLDPARRDALIAAEGVTKVL
ncbi:TIGR03089 family protein [Micromonospora sp. NBC_01655]|uniref:TIGR03089 family protein n=1 Tax=Micromonospora sp. NBC_01655 TaxID=2975983 RepID=UPI002253687F|nr:TIGR03089 family protein [Micromonospora sp. NBC_01655]MCX4474736.1 TIGR03089 family protein [Micromonospora sp. NBC_01655]